MENPSFYIKKAEFGDLDALVILFDEYRVFYQQPSDIESAKTFLSERIQNNDSHIYIAMNEENKMMGFIQLYPIFSSTRMKRLYLLNDLYVNPSFRGKYVSVSLINQAKELSQSTKAAGLILETSKSNTIGNKLYPKTGFILDTEHNYYSWSE